MFGKLTALDVIDAMAEVKDYVVLLRTQIKSLQAENELLKNCMNCEYWDRFYTTCGKGCALMINDRCKEWQKSTE